MIIAVLIPCYNEELTIGKVIADFKEQLPDASIYVYDNNSSDNTFSAATLSGAIVVKEPRQGKGNVLRSMFRNIDADIYVLVDGDDTYPAEACHELIQTIAEGEADMAVGDRLSKGVYKKENKRKFHNFGNSLVKHIINFLYKAQLQDIMSGYRCFNKKFVKTIPILSGFFEIETEITLHALDKKFLIKELPVKYRDRPHGSFSKLSTFKDGFRILKIIFILFKNYRPFLFFTVVSGLFLILGLLCGAPVIIEYIHTQYITHVPLAILAVGFIILAGLLFICGLILDTVVQNYKCLYELYLNKDEKL